MDYTIRLDEERRIVTATAKGDWNSDADDSMIVQIMEMVDATGIRKVLLDIRELRFKVSIVQIFRACQKNCDNTTASDDQRKSCDRLFLRSPNFG